MSNTRTGFGSVSQLANWLGCPQPAEYINGATLNAKLQIQQGQGLGTGETTRLVGIMLGVGGLTYSTATNGRTRQSTVPHKPVDGAPFEILPLCVRDIGNDLSVTERQRYALRQIKNINGVDRIIYNARRMSFRESVIKMQERTTINGSTTARDFAPDASVLNPVPTVVSTENVNPLEGVSLVATARLNLVLDAFDVNEIINAAQIVYGSENDAYVTEVQLLQGVERQVDGGTGQAGQTVSYTELIACQVGQHITSRIFIPDFRDGYSSSYEIGGADPMFVLS